MAQIAVALKEEAKFDTSETHLDLSFSDEFTPDFSGFNYYISLYHPWSENGVLPYPGSTSEQPAKIMEVFSILDKLKYEHEKAQQKELERKQRG